MDNAPTETVVAVALAKEAILNLQRTQAASETRQNEILVHIATLAANMEGISQSTARVEGRLEFVLGHIDKRLDEQNVRVQLLEQKVSGLQESLGAVKAQVYWAMGILGSSIVVVIGGLLKLLGQP